MDQLIILTCVSMNEPTKETYFEFYPSNKNELKSKVKEIKKTVIQNNIDAYELYKRNNNEKECPYNDGYMDPSYKKSSKIDGIFAPLDNGDIFLIEKHTSYTFAYAITVLNLQKDNTFILYEH